MSGKISWEEAVAWLVAQPQHEALVCGSYFDPPLADAALRYSRSSEWASIREWISMASAKALDVGAGNGITTFALVRDGWNVTALEPDSSTTVGAGAIEQLMANASLPVTIVRAFGEEIPFGADEFDLVIARQVLHHARNLDRLCDEMARVLKPGGRLITLRDHVITRAEDLATFLAKHPLHALYGGESAFSWHAYVAALRKAGLVVERVVKPFDSVVNYAPYTRDDLRRIIALRTRPAFLRRAVEAALKNDKILSAVLSALSRFDDTPGRLYSFVCRKPMRVVTA